MSFDVLIKKLIDCSFHDMKNKFKIVYSGFI